MHIYTISIGRSSYDIPYNSHEDLLQLKKICFEANKLVNSILSTNQTITNEFALVLALVNVIYEGQFSLSRAAHKPETRDNVYTQEDILGIISHMNNKLFEIEQC
jgi:aminoglycoside N3'-acetyltransferase